MNLAKQLLKALVTGKPKPFRSGGTQSVNPPQATKAAPPKKGGGK